MAAKGTFLLFNLIHTFSLLWFLVLSETRCSRQKTESSNNNIVLSESSDTIYSPEYHSQLTYSANMTCIWIITVPQDHQQIKLTFSVFNLQPANPTCQTGDYVEVRDGKSSSSTILGTFCGSRIPSDLVSSERYMWVYFHSNAAVEKRGFVANYETYSSSNGISAILICVGLGLTLLVFMAVIFGGRAFKRRRKYRKTGKVRIWQTRPGITIKIYPATPSDNRSEVSLNASETSGSLILPGARPDAVLHG